MLKKSTWTRNLSDENIEILTTVNIKNIYSRRTSFLEHVDYHRLITELKTILFIAGNELNHRKFAEQLFRIEIIVNLFYVAFTRERSVGHVNLLAAQHLPVNLPGFRYFSLS